MLACTFQYVELGASLNRSHGAMSFMGVRPFINLTGSVSFKTHNTCKRCCPSLFQHFTSWHHINLFFQLTYKVILSTVVDHVVLRFHVLFCKSDISNFLMLILIPVLHSITNYTEECSFPHPHFQKKRCTQSRLCKRATPSFSSCLAQYHEKLLQRVLVSKAHEGHLPH